MLQGSLLASQVVQINRSSLRAVGDKALVGNGQKSAEAFDRLAFVGMFERLDARRVVWHEHFILLRLLLQ